MNDWKTRVIKMLDAERGKVELKLREMQGNYNDTGYERYYNLVQKYEAQLDEIDTYRNAQLSVARAEGEARRLRKGIYAYREHLKAYGTNHKDVYRPVDETAKALLDMLELDMAQSGATI